MIVVGLHRPGTGRDPSIRPRLDGEPVVVLHRAVGNRATPKVCGVLPSQEHAELLMSSLLKAEGALMDLFYEATDDGIEALEAVLLATWTSVMDRATMPEGGPTRDELAAERERIQHDLDTAKRPNGR